MTFPIGFFTHPSENTKLQEVSTTQISSVVPKKSLVQIAFPGRGMNLTYFNDQFDLHKGDLHHTFRNPLRQKMMIGTTSGMMTIGTVMTNKA